MKYAGLIKNDVVNGQNVCVSLWVQGCPFHCKGCHNPQTWDFDGGYEDKEILDKIFKALTANNIKRNFSVLGGEPLCQSNREEVAEIIAKVRESFPEIKIYIWTGYTLEELQKENNSSLISILNNIDVLIDGRFEIDKRDITLPLRGSRNQRVLYRGIDF